MKQTSGSCMIRTHGGHASSPLKFATPHSLRMRNGPRPKIAASSDNDSITTRLGTLLISSCTEPWPAGRRRDSIGLRAPRLAGNAIHRGDYKLDYSGSSGVTVLLSCRALRRAVETRSHILTQ
jgi:hypothetical protein